MTVLPRNTILIGDARERLARLPAAGIDCIVTSPPYFAVRDYGDERQLGHEPDVDAWVAGLRAVFHEAARALTPTGSLWLNLGDGYARHSSEGASPKSLLLGPERLALALLADGWLLRNKVVWAKTNPMPTSVRDRLACTYEVVYFFTRSPRYYFDLDAIRAPLRTTQRRTAHGSGRTYPPPGAGAPTRAGRARNGNGGLGHLKTQGRAGHPLGKNPGDVWQLPTASFRGAHFATFPAALAERPLLATCPAEVCTACARSVDARTPCGCRAPTRPGVVLDPFLGSGTVAVAAERLGRNWLGIELSPAYAALAEQRIAGARLRRQSSTTPLSGTASNEGR